MDQFTYLRELIAVIAGTLLVLTPLVVRFISGWRRAGGEKKTARRSSFRSRIKSLSKGRMARKGVPNTGPPAVDNYIKRIQKGKPGSNVFPPLGTRQQELPSVEQEDWVEKFIEIPDLKTTNYRGWDKETSRSSGWRRISELPPLKRAIVMQEVLGSPVGLGGSRHDD